MTQTVPIILKTAILICSKIKSRTRIGGRCTEDTTLDVHEQVDDCRRLSEELKEHCHNNGSSSLLFNCAMRRALLFTAIHTSIAISRQVATKNTFSTMQSLQHVSKNLHLKKSIDFGLPGPENFEVLETMVSSNDLADGALLIQVLAVSADPYLRNSIKITEGAMNAGTNKQGAIMQGFVSGKVLRSNNPAWIEGDFFAAHSHFSTVQIVSKESVKGFRKLTGLIEGEHQISLGVGILGMPGATAYGGLIDVLRPLAGETIFVSAAAGAVGGLVGMIAKNVYGCKVIGSCGGPVKCALIKEKYGFDHAIDYKAIPDAKALIAELKKVAPEGIDMYFESVGGMHFEAAFASLRDKGRIAVCGEIAEYSAEHPNLSSISLMRMIYTFQRIEGFVCGPWLRGEKGDFAADISKWIKEGKVVLQEESFTDGLENWPAAFNSLFTGANIGKVVVRV